MELGMVSGEKWKSSDDMKAVMSRPPVVSRFRFPGKYRALLLEESPGIYRPNLTIKTKPELSKDGMLVYTSFSCYFIEQRAEVLKKEWRKVRKTLALYDISCHIYLNMRIISFSTTPRTRGTDILYKTRDLFHLLAYTPVPPPMALQILDGSLLYDTIWTRDIRSKLSFKKEGDYLRRVKNIQRNIKDLAAVSHCSIFLNEMCVTTITKSPKGLSLVRNIVTGCIAYGQNPGTRVRLINMSRERNGQKDNLEMDAYGFESSPGVKFVSFNRGLLDDYPPPKSLKEKFVFGPSPNKDGAIVCGSFFFGERDQAVAEAWPLLKSILEDYGISCTMYLAERFMTLSTTSRTEDPDIIYKARDVLEILSFTRVRPSMVLKVLTDNLQYDMIRIGSSDGGYCSEYKIDRKLFEKRRRRFNRHLTELGELTGCAIFNNVGHTVTVLGYGLGAMKFIRITVKRCIVDNVRPSTMLRKKVKRRRERRKMREESAAGLVDNARP